MDRSDSPTKVKKKRIKEDIPTRTDETSRAPGELVRELRGDEKSTWESKGTGGEKAWEKKRIFWLYISAGGGFDQSRAFGRSLKREKGGTKKGEGMRTWEISINGGRRYIR